MMFTFPRTKRTPSEQFYKENGWSLAIHQAEMCLAVALEIMPSMPAQSTRLAVETLEYLRKLGVDGLPPEGEVDIFYEDLFAAWLQEDDLIVQAGSISKWLEDLATWQAEFLKRNFHGVTELHQTRAVQGERLLQTFLENRPEGTPETEQEAVGQGRFWLVEALSQFEQDAETRKVVKLLVQAHEQFQKTYLAEGAGRWHDFLVRRIAASIIVQDKVSLGPVMDRIFEWYEETLNSQSQ